MHLKDAMTQSNQTATNNQFKMENRVVWLDFLMFSASILLQGFHYNWLFYIVGGLAILLGALGIFLKWLPVPFVALSSKENKLEWLAFLMFAAGLFFQGFHNDMGFWIAGGIGLIVGFIGFISGYNWDK
jgi:hypothetical protein